MASRSILCRSRRLRQITDLREQQSSWIIVLSFDERAWFLMNIFGKRSDLPFTWRAIARRRKVWYHLSMSRILFAAKHSRRTFRLCMSRLLFVDSYLLFTWWALGQWKGRNISIEHKMCYAFGQEPITELAQPVISVIGLLDFLLKRLIAIFFRRKLL